MELISSLHNPKVVRWRSLKEKKGRDAAGIFLAEGPKMVAEALNAGFAAEAVLVRSDFHVPFPLPSGVPVYELPDHVFRSVCDTRTPQGLAAIIRFTALPLKGSLLVALDGLQDPGNMGTVIRTADAAGFDGVIVGPDCVDVFSPKVLRATMGSVFHVGLSFPPSLPEALRNYRDEGFAVISSQLDGDPFFSRAPVAPPLVLVIGNEGNGISAEVRSLATHRLRLPMRGKAESLNASVAAGIMMYDLVRSLP